MKTPSKNNLMFAFFLLFFTLSIGLALAQGRWTQAAPMPEERSEVPAAGLNGKIYVAGGFGVTRILWEYDIRVNRWRKRAPLPLPLHHTGIASVGGKLYVIGGYSDHEWKPVGNVFAYDSVRDRWQERATMPTARGGLAVGILYGKIHAVGGLDLGGDKARAHEVYDPTADKWTSPRGPC